MVADAQSTWRLGFRTAFEREGFVVVAEAATAADVVRVPERRRPATILRERGVRLTPRECQVFDLLAHDAGTRDMAADLGISAVTVRRHVSELLHKLGVEDRAAARRLFRETAPPA